MRATEIKVGSMTMKEKAEIGGLSKQEIQEEKVSWESLIPNIENRVKTGELRQDLLDAVLEYIDALEYCLQKLWGDNSSSSLSAGDSDTSSRRSSHEDKSEIPAGRAFTPGLKQKQEEMLKTSPGHTETSNGKPQIALDYDAIIKQCEQNIKASKRRQKKDKGHGCAIM